MVFHIFALAESKTLPVVDEQNMFLRKTIFDDINLIIVTCDMVIYIQRRIQSFLNHEGPRLA